MIRPLVASDVDRVIDIWHRASLIAHRFLPQAFLEAERQAIVDEWLPIAETVVCESDGHVVGFISLIGNEVGGIFVDPEHQGQGIGRELMDHARRRRAFLELDVFAANEVGRGFYDAYGFRLMASSVDERTGQTTLRLRHE